MSVLPAAKRRIYRFYLPLTLALSFINFWRLGFYGGRHASKHALIGLYTGFPGRNGDHMYYTSMAIQFAGKSLTQSVTQTATTFKDYSAPSIDLVRGYLDPGFAPLNLSTPSSYPADVVGISNFWLKWPWNFNAVYWCNHDCSAHSLGLARVGSRRSMADAWAHYGKLHVYLVLNWAIY